MPMYTFSCKRCKHEQTNGLTVAGFVAAKSQEFLFMRCGRCNRRGTMSHDFIADAKTQASHGDEFTFHENAPEERLVGKTVSRKEAKAILKKHGLAESGASGKRRSHSGTRTYREQEIVDRWEAARAKPDTAEVATEEVSSGVDKLVDTNVGELDTMVCDSWPGLKSQAKRLGIKVIPTIKRPELERLVRERIST